MTSNSSSIVGSRGTSHHESSSRPRHQPITIVSTDQGPRVGPYIFGKTLGTGSTGKVKLAKNLLTGEIVAIKIVRKDYLDNKPSLKKKMRREISVLKVLSHPNLMSLIDVFEIETHLFLVMEFVDGLELFEYLVRRGALPIPQALSFFQQIICGLEYCHHRLICHRDLKPENLLLDRNLNIKIADFGMTSLNPPGNLLETSCGSPHYCDPMVVSGEMYDGLKADIWSCGVILYAMVTGRLPFDDDNIQRLLQKVQMGQYHLPLDLPKELRDIIKRMLTVDPETRITLEQIKAHPWFNSIPPRNYTEDNFVVPRDPIVSPDPLIMRSLVDLGWGDAKSVAAELGKVGPSMEKVFYQQLEQHPMYNRPSAVRPSRRSASSNHTNSSSSTPAAENSSSEQQKPPAEDSSAQAPARTRPSARAEQLSSEMASLSIQNNGTNNNGTTTSSNANTTTNSEDGSSNGKDDDKAAGSNGSSSGATLVRQSSLRGMSEMIPQEDNEQRVEQALHEVTHQKSWFHTMTKIWSTGNNDAAASASSVPEEDNHNEGDEQVAAPNSSNNQANAEANTEIDTTTSTIVHNAHNNTYSHTEC